MAKKGRVSKEDIIVLKWVAKVCKKEMWHIILLLFVQTVNASLTVLYANYSKNIINAATVDGSFDKVLKYAIGFFILVTVQLVLTMLSRSICERCRCRMEWIMKQHLLLAVMKKDYAKVTKHHTGDLQNRMFNDVTVVANNFTSLLPTIVFLLVKLICAFVYLVVLDRVFALVFIVGGVLVFLLTFCFRTILKNLHSRVMESEGRTRSFIQEALTSLLVVKTFAVEDKVAKESNELQAENYKFKMRRRFFSITANSGLSFVFNCGYVFALVLGGYRLINGSTYGTIIAIIQLVNQIQQPFAALSTAMPTYFEILASAERLREVDLIPDEEANNDEFIDVVDTYNRLECLDFNNITFGYDRDLILDSTSLKINKGDFVAIMGISGIGKSTLLKLLLGVFHVESGDINICLDDTKIPVDYHTRKLFSYVPQGNFLLSGTIRENLLFINDDVTEEEIQQAIEISCADQFINELPLGLETVIGERGIGLSEGQLQRLAIARSLLSKSPVMLLDEATSALDEDTELRFLSNLKELNDKTCIIVSHKRAALEICNKHIQIVDSKIVLEEK